MTEPRSTMIRNSKRLPPGKTTIPMDSKSLFSASNLSKAAPFLAALEQQLYQPITPRQSLQIQSSQAEEEMRATRRQQTNQYRHDDEKSVSNNYFEVPYETCYSQAAVDEDEAEKGREQRGVPKAKDEAPNLTTAQRQRSVAEACRFLRQFIETRWENQLHAGYIKIQCDLTMAEMWELGRLNKSDGSRECRRLVSAPVIHDAIGYALWSELARTVGNGGAVVLPSSSSDPSLSTVVAKLTAAEEVAARRARSTRRRATEGDAIARHPTPFISSTYFSITARVRRKSELQLARPHQLACTKCGGRAPLERKSVDSPLSDDEDAQEERGGNLVDEGEGGLELRVKKRNSISRRLSVKMNQTLARFGEGLATGYGGNGVSRVSG
ncbi:hypothetical protein QIS74_04164 [Colletotrichum tabaci]|uniref:Uncharacterized protein n=1 Tax=Colletotrichum tabaci TaxID=1209068 RepID=A0AAV9TKZ2_9PEZI